VDVTSEGAGRVFRFVRQSGVAISAQLNCFQLSASKFYCPIYRMTHALAGKCLTTCRGEEVVHAKRFVSLTGSCTCGVTVKSVPRNFFDIWLLVMMRRSMTAQYAWGLEVVSWCFFIALCPQRENTVLNCELKAKNCVILITVIRSCLETNVHLSFHYF
jgi:hypothetical protein